MKKKLTALVNKALANATFKVAKAGAGVQSFWSWYQPRVPKKIAK